MKIKHPALNNRSVEIKDPKIVQHTISIEGEDKLIDFVEFIRIGNHREWPDAIQYSRFKKSNPKTIIK